MLQKTTRRLVELILGINEIMKGEEIRGSKRYTGPTVRDDKIMEKYL